jgi:short/branched chain acyl-CoA dehydrogenase
MLESPISRFYADAKILEIGEGTSEIQRNVIARLLLVEPVRGHLPADNNLGRSLE